MRGRSCFSKRKKKRERVRDFWEEVKLISGSKSALKDCWSQLDSLFDSYSASVHWSFGKYQRCNPAVSRVFAITHLHTTQLWRPTAAPVSGAGSVCSAGSSVIFLQFTTELLLLNCEAQLNVPRRHLTSFKALYSVTSTVSGPHLPKASWKAATFTAGSPTLQLSRLLFQLGKTSWLKLQDICQTCKSFLFMSPSLPLLHT